MSQWLILQLRIIALVEPFNRIPHRYCHCGRFKLNFQRLYDRLNLENRTGMEPAPDTVSPFASNTGRSAPTTYDGGASWCSLP